VNKLLSAAGDFFRGVWNLKVHAIISCVFAAIATLYFNDRWQDHPVTNSEFIVLWLVMLMLIPICIRNMDLAQIYKENHLTGRRTMTTLMYLATAAVILIAGSILAMGVGRLAGWSRVNIVALPTLFVVSSISGATIGLLLFAAIGPRISGIDLSSSSEPQSIALVPEPERPVPELTVRDFLKPNDREPAGLGLYSYLLFGSSGNSDYARKFAAIRAYLSDFATYKETGSILSDRRKLAGFFVFTAEDLEWIDQCDKKGFVHLKRDDANSPMIPTWTCRDKGGPAKTYDLEDLSQIVLTKYDYQRASLLLNRVMDAHLLTDPNQIYIVSYVNPLQGISLSDTSTVLVQGLSGLPPDYMESWVLIPKAQFTKAEYWNKDQLDYAILRIRTILAQAAPIVSLTETALASDLINKIWPSSQKHL
jgi:hypothetical protein